ncbi:MAG: hypothetical protein ACTTJZ_08155 [Sphaerochaetaceae bacterium]
MKPRIGIIEIRNLLTDQCLYLASDDTFADCAKVRFMLDLGTHPCKSLQADYTATGLELFEIREVELLAKPGEKPDALARWQESCTKPYPDNED